MIDFGLSRACLDQEAMTQDVGSVVYKAPEIMAGRYTESSDLWSFGMVSHMLLTGLVPWEGSSRSEIEDSIRRELSDHSEFHGLLAWMLASSQVSEEGVSFVTGLLTPDTETRLTCATARAHPWLSGGRVGSRMKASTRTSKEKQLHVVQKLKQFRNNDALKRAVLLAMSFGVASAEMVSLGEAFKKLDADQDGLIGWEEFNDALKMYGSSDPDENREIFEAINQDGTGKIKYSEFVASQLEKDVFDANAQLEAAFSRLDFNGDGKIGMAELIILLQGPDEDDEDARAEALRVLTGMGKNADGEIDVEEFKVAMRGVFSPEEIDHDSPTPEVAEDSIGQFKLMQLRLASQLQFRTAPSFSDAASPKVPSDHKIGQFKLRQLMLASRLQFRTAPSTDVPAESTVGQFKLRRLMLASQLQALKNKRPDNSQPANHDIPPLTRKKSTNLAPGSFRRRLNLAQDPATQLEESKAPALDADVPN